MSATNKAGYTATKVACGWGRGSDEKANPSYWAGVVMQKPLLTAKKTNGDGRKAKWLDGWMDVRMDRRTDGRTDGRMDRRTDGWMDGWTDGWMAGQTDGEKEQPT